MKKALSLILAVVMLLGMVACGGEKAPESTAPESSAPESNGPESGTPEAAKWEGNVNMYVAASAGGGTDMAARTIAQYINENYDVNLTVINNNDGGGAVPYEAVRTSKPDGSTLLFFHTTMCIKYGTNMYDHNPATDFSVIAFASSKEKGGYMLVVPYDSPYQTLDDYIKAAEAEPGKMMIGVETGGGSHIQCGMFAQAAGIELNYVEAGPDTDKLTALVGGSIPSALVNANSAKQYIEANKIRALACVSTDEEGSRNSVLPDVPSFIEQGINFTYDLRFMVLGAPGMDPALVEVINDCFVEAVQDPAVDEQLCKSGWGMTFAEPAESQADLAKVQDELTEACAALGLQK
ncbi:MAG: tripartite tricarboxylate transporter substrate-binding protein [Candidatus Heteroscillospira sp.]|jgi:putative tricarboxylic transport membrane protein